MVFIIPVASLPYAEVRHDGRPWSRTQLQRLAHLPVPAVEISHRLLVESFPLVGAYPHPCFALSFTRSVVCSRILVFLYLTLAEHDSRWCTPSAAGVSLYSCFSSTRHSPSTIPNGVLRPSQGVSLYSCFSSTSRVTVIRGRRFTAFLLFLSLMVESSHVAELR